jgi:crotonobetainyl-CoA:carnitine CoA-transferase CaiB-like acyl-CoA transferase
MFNNTSLNGIQVLEIGSRIGVGASGTLLASLGAEVFLVDSIPKFRPNKWSIENNLSIGKKLINLEEVNSYINLVDIVLISTDISDDVLYQFSDTQIVCDITAYGKTSSLTKDPHPDALIQAVSGLADTTGQPDGPPILCNFTISECLAALVATAGILAALRERHFSKKGQHIDIALYDCVFSTFQAFLPFSLINKEVTRAGHTHVSSAPWNIYRTKDGHVIICTGTDQQWVKLCQAMKRFDLLEDDTLKRSAGRIAKFKELDLEVSKWTADKRTNDIVSELDGAGIPAGQIHTVQSKNNEPNILHRNVLKNIDGNLSLNSPIKYFIEEQKQESTNLSLMGDLDQPYSDIKVLDLGQFTTAPLAARHLGALGASVYKVESPSGDACRYWTPSFDNQSYFFALSNSNKKSLMLDLQNENDLTIFNHLIQTADVLVENLKPGSLEKLGFSSPMLSKINPKLIYCAVSGFGSSTVYPGRPAFDTVIQAMSGMMDLVRSDDGSPQKVGVSLADVLGGLFGLIGISAALYVRDLTGVGRHIDISMQDSAAWITQFTPKVSVKDDLYTTIQCTDGYVVAVGEVVASHNKLSRYDLVAHLDKLGIVSAPVLTINEVHKSSQVSDRELLVYALDSTGRSWPAFASPIRLSRTPPSIRGAIGNLGEVNPNFVGWPISDSI